MGVSLGDYHSLDSGFNHSAAFTLGNFPEPIGSKQFNADIVMVDGGAILARGSLSLSDVTLTNNRAERDGGGLNAIGVATINNSHFIGNSAATRDGGGIFVAGGLSITSTVFQTNTAGNKGGGLYANETTTLSDTTFISNQSAGDAGGAYVVEDTTVETATFESRCIERT